MTDGRPTRALRRSRFDACVGLHGELGNQQLGGIAAPTGLIGAGAAKLAEQVDKALLSTEEHPGPADRQLQQRRAFRVEVVQKGLAQPEGGGPQAATVTFTGRHLGLAGQGQQLLVAERPVAGHGACLDPRIGGGTRSPRRRRLRVRRPRPVGISG